ncbi:hypothetical protein ACLKA6_018247 [Drosophila palustris]
MTRSGRSDQIQYLHLTWPPIAAQSALGLLHSPLAVTIYDVQRLLEQQGTGNKQQQRHDDVVAVVSKAQPEAAYEAEDGAVHQPEYELGNWMSSSIPAMANISGSLCLSASLLQLQVAISSVHANCFHPSDSQIVAIQRSQFIKARSEQRFRCSSIRRSLAFGLWIIIGIHTSA